MKAKIEMLLRVIRSAEDEVAKDLLAIGRRHQSDHEVYHLTRDLAEWSHEHVRMLDKVAAEAGISLDAGHDDDAVTALKGARDPLPEQDIEPPLLLLADLRRIHLDCVGLSVDWEVLAQAAQGEKDDRLLQLAQRCQPDALRQARWANSLIKVVSPQIMAT
jgi:hypothetical protein